jgi:hypothetical protein
MTLGRYLLRVALGLVIVVLAGLGARQLWQSEVAPNLKSPATRAVEEQAQASGNDMFDVGADQSAVFAVGQAKHSPH